MGRSIHIPAAQMWDFFETEMTPMVASGRVTIPVHVERELRPDAPHPDVPAAWAFAKARLGQVRREPSPERVRSVLSVFPRLIDPDSEREDADPYVVALALELEDAGQDVVVVTHDVTDRPPLKTSVKTACDHFGIEVMDLNQFRAAIAPDTRDATQLGLPSSQEPE